MRFIDDIDTGINRRTRLKSAAAGSLLSVANAGSILGSEGGKQSYLASYDELQLCRPAI